VAGCCEHGKEPSDFIKYWEFLEYLCDCSLLKKDPAYYLRMLRFLTEDKCFKAVVFNRGYAYPRGTRRHLRGYVKFKISIYILFHE
jgi:hypothetical protein